MLGRAIQLADWLDTWLKDRVGWPYNSLLGSGIGMGIVASIATIDRALVSPSNVAVLGGTLLFQVALLINQLAQLHQMREERRTRRAERQARKAATTEA